MASAEENLEALLDRLEDGLLKTRRRDAIDAILAGDPRSTAVRSLREQKVVEQFRRELTDGRIRLDTVSKLLGWVRTIIDAVSK